MSFSVYEVQETSQKAKTELRYVTVSCLPDHVVLHFLPNRLAGPAARRGRPQASVSMAIRLTLLLTVSHNPPTSPAVSCIKEDRLDRLQGQSTRSPAAGPPQLLPPQLLVE